MPTTPNPFIQKTVSEKRMNLGLMALAVFYVVQIVFNLQRENVCRYFAVDYCAFWSAGYIANTSGYADVYDLNVIRKVQGPLFAESFDSESSVLLPVAYFSVFILPFQLFALIPPLPGYLIWSFINLVSLIAYLYFFCKKIFGHFLSVQMSFMLLLSLPVFLDLFFGQVNLWLMICTGEFIHALMEGKAYRAGFWLGGLLLKPQLLILLIPVLILQRMVKVLLGFGISGIAILLASISLSGFDGIHDLVGLWLGFTNGIPSNMVEVMMNWRMLTINLSNFGLSLAGWVITFGGILATLTVVFLLWRKPIPVEAPNFHIAFFGMLVATGLVAWHSHLSTAMILIPTIIILYFQGQFPQKLFSFWVFLPPAARFMAPLLLAIFIQVPTISTDAMNTLVNILNLLFGFPGLILNIGFLVWSYLMFFQRHTEQDMGTSL